MLPESVCGFFLSGDPTLSFRLAMHMGARVDLRREGTGVARKGPGAQDQPKDGVTRIWDHISTF